ncbi:putative baseplate assembly protein [Catellatospora sp. TT07R-123]|uniref:putative baseplate assembly protein n=1 Tax=Catellatospora sp. TT07R-123 TaxID=2733863 RepID=UPI001B1FCE72|nr:putative baseplate assembly protein [Catellatospora sp. TT07R-123]GHJ45272.1 putative baseplate assembly protein [Catellatospora sp. TT07R-123]
MTTPTPRLDDRSFQDLVDDAKRLVQQRCPGWTDHNVSDPGVTLLELFAWMTDIVLYRLNRVPDRLYLRFLDLMGIVPFPPTAARADITFRLTAPRPATVTVPAGTQASTRRVDDADPAVFTTVEALDIVPCELSALATVDGAGQAVDRTSDLDRAMPFLCFSTPPVPDECVLIGLSAAVPRCLAALRLDCEIQGHGVDPRWPPLAWEAWTADGWRPCDVERDDTGGLNIAGDVLLHVPAGHASTMLAGRQAGWLRCRVVPTVEGQKAYSDSPRLTSARAHTIGGTAHAVHATVVDAEDLGVSTGVAGQRFPLTRHPVIPDEPAPVLEVGRDDTGGDGGWRAWQLVDDFASAGPDDPVFRIDALAGEVQFGPAVRQSDGSLRGFGAVPAKGARLRVRGYRAGGGAAGNVAAHLITVLKTSLPYLRGEVDNRRAAVGGVDGETIDEMRERAPLALRARDRAVTAADYEQLARQAAPEVGRVTCVPVSPGDEAVRVLVVPNVGADGPMSFADLVPDAELLSSIAAYLEPRRIVGTRVLVAPPVYQAVTVVATLHARPGRRAADIEPAALRALHRHLHPLVGGPAGTGWPYGRSVHIGEIFAVLQQVPGVDLVEDVKLFPADAVTGRRGEAVRRIEVAGNALAFGYQHVLKVEE